ncbi:E3 SUMO-protein ligase ZBED1 isoform X1 [Halyomorpha halys]|uniref:E3 SUMO-protein ligase ZBED1 isoform X1 n=1 Tax=Halyomorpha halys TaxID=286706 RepID=UPI0034D1D5E5
MDKPKKGKHKYSPIWNLFEVIDRDCAKCLICAKRFSYRSTTSNLRKHIDRKHSTLQVIHSTIPGVNSDTTEYASPQSQIFQLAGPPKKVVQQAASQHIQIKLIPTQQVNTQPVNAQQIYTPQFNLQSSAAFKKLKKDRKPVQNESDRSVNDALMQLFIKDFHPISTVEDEGFRSFITALNPTCEIPSKKCISQKLLPAMYEKCLENARTISKSITSACITTECWTSNNDESFLAITAHFLDSDFYLKSVLLSCSLLEENFTSESLADELHRNVNEWELQNKIFFSVSSGEDYIANAIKMIPKWEHFGCFIHSLNKVVGDALSLKPVEELISKVRQVVSFFKNDPMASSELQLSQINCNIEPKKLKQDIPMMWNSTFYMIERFVELENAISCTVTIQESNYLLIQPDEWTVLKELTKILKSLEAITKAADQENYMLASLPIVLTNGLFEICRKLESCVELSDTTKQVVMKLKNGFNGRFSELTKNPILSVCTFLDPRFKTIPFGNNEGSVKKRVVDLVMKHLHLDNTQTGEAQGIASQSQNIEELSVWEVFDKSAANSKLEASGDSRAQLEVDRYIEDDLINRNSDPLEWWRVHRYNYPHLSEVVREIFCSLATSVPCSRLFTKSGNIIMDRRSKLSAGKLKQLVFLNANEKFS